jgi:hypothetical protein
MLFRSHSFKNLLAILLKKLKTSLMLSEAFRPLKYGTTSRNDEVALQHTILICVVKYLLV